MQNYPGGYQVIENRPFTNHVDYGLSRGFITSSTESFPYACSPHFQEIRIASGTKPFKDVNGTDVKLIFLTEGVLNQPITMPGLNYGCPMKLNYL